MNMKTVTHRLAQHRDLVRQERALARALARATTPSARQELLVLRGQ